MQCFPLSRKAAGFSLLEVLLALLIFSLAAVALVQAIHVLGLAGTEASHDRRIQDKLNLFLKETTRKPLPPMTLGNPYSETLREPEATYEIRIEPLEKQNSENQQLQDLYKVQVIARWREAGRDQIMKAETWLYPPLYAPSR